MLKITTIKPFEEKVEKQLADIENDFLARVNRDTNPYSGLIQLRNTPNLYDQLGNISRALTSPELITLNYIISNYDNIIIGTPAQLAGHINTIGSGHFGSTVHSPRFGDRFQVSEFGKRIYEIFSYEKHFRTKQNKGIWLAKQLNIKTCPYCNSQYTLIVKSNSGGLKARFQFDHFYSKKQFPYLSISLYNLIPSCAPCNLSKGEKPTRLDTHYHPYHSDLSYQANFSPEYPLDLKKLSIGDVAKLNIKIKFKSRFKKYAQIVEDHNKLYEIESSYERHVDVVEDLLRTAILYNKSTRKDIFKIKGLFDKDESAYLRYLIGNYGLKDEIHQRPLSKLTQDMAKIFELTK